MKTRNFYCDPQEKMKVFQFHQYWLTLNFMCDKDNENSIQKFSRIFFNYFQRLLLLSILIPTLLFLYEENLAGNFEEVLYGIFQLNAMSFALIETTVMTCNRRQMRRAFDYLQEFVDKCWFCNSKNSEL